MEILNEHAGDASPFCASLDGELLAQDSGSPASDEGSGYKRKKTSSRHSEMPKIEEREVKKSKRSAEEKAEKKEKKERRATEGGAGSSRVEEGKRPKKEDKAKVRASDAGVYQSKQREGKEESNGKGKMRASDAGIYHRDDEGKKREDKGKGKARESLGGAPAADYVPHDAGSSYRLHEKVSPLMGEPKRLQELLEFAIEAEQKEVEAFYTGRNKFIADAFEEVASNFILESERATIAQIKKEANTIRPASAAKKAEESPAKPNPVNIQRASEEKKLKEALKAFEAEEMEWHAVAEAASSQQQTTFQPLPSVSGPVASSHCVMQVLVCPSPQPSRQ